MITLRQLEYFVVVSEHGSFRKAASALQVNESAVSRSIRDLEDRLGASLFQRHSAGVFLTMAGHRFVPHARKALRQIEHGTRDVAAIGRSTDGWITIGIFSSLASGFLSKLFQAFDKSHPGVRIELIEGDPTDHVAAVRQLRRDIAFVAGTPLWSDCETDRLWSERIFAVLPISHPLCNKQDLRWEDLIGERFITNDGASGRMIQNYLLQRLADLGRYPEIHVHYVSRDNLLSLVSIGKGLAVISEAGTAAQFPGVVYRCLLNEFVPFCAVWSPRNDNPACRRLLSLARTMSRSVA